MMPLCATALFSGDGSGLWLLLLVLAALVIGLYLWGNARKGRTGKADRLQETYKTMTRPLLDGIPDGELVNAVAANLLAKLDKRRPDAYQTIPALSRGRCAVYSVWMTTHEIETGGLAAYLSGPSGQFASLAADGCELVGAPACAAVLREAVREPLDGRAAAALQARFLEAAARENPLDGCREYIRNSPGEFLDEESPAEPAG